jgi:hypothetical protein
MAADTRASTSDRVFDSLLEQQATIFDTLRTTADRYHRFNHSLLEGGRQSVREWTEVGRLWMARPTDVIALYEAVADAVGAAQARTLALAREWIEDRVEAQREAREAARRSFGDVREAVQRAQESAPEFLRRGASRSKRSNGAREAAATDA